MKEFTIVKNDREHCTTITARNARNALELYRKGLMSSGFYWFEKVDGEPVLRTSYGASFKAV